VFFEQCRGNLRAKIAGGACDEDCHKSV
jgi:hypothetical protein